MKAILISIKPKYVADILNGKKTIEVRKSCPKCDLPIDVYIYCTKDKDTLLTYQPQYPRFICPNQSVYVDRKKAVANSFNGKVVAKFTVRKVEEIKEYTYPRYYGEDICDEDDFYYLESQPLSERKYDGLQKTTCLSEEELYEYLNGEQGYAYHIEDLVIFDKPKDPCYPITPFVLDKVWEKQRNKLGQLEDIEDKIGISIVDFYKLTQAEKIYLLRFKAYYEVEAIDLKTWEIVVYNKKKSPSRYTLKIKNYGNTWCFKKGGDNEQRTSNRKAIANVR